MGELRELRGLHPMIDWWCNHCGHHVGAIPVGATMSCPSCGGGILQSWQPGAFVNFVPHRASS